MHLRVFVPMYDSACASVDVCVGGWTGRVRACVCVRMSDRDQQIIGTAG